MTARDERGAVGEDVARRIQVPVAGGVGRSERASRRKAGPACIDIGGVEPLDVEAERALQRDALVRRLRGEGARGITVSPVY